MDRLNTTILSEKEISTAAQLLRQGNLVGLPTETVYGLAANGLDTNAVEQIFLAKGRPADNPLILHVADATWISRYCLEQSEDVQRLTDVFWPGALTLILQRRDNVPDLVTAGLDTVGVRCPNHPLALSLLKEVNVPLAAPSGNTSGRPSPTSAIEMYQDMEGKIPAILDGGPCDVGVESTILDVRGEPRILRVGGISVEDIERVLGKPVALDPALDSKVENLVPLAPGMKYRHYAPEAPVTVVLGEKSHKWILEHMKDGDGVLCFEEYRDLFSHGVTRTIGKEKDYTTQAQQVFSALRFFDSTDVPRIFTQCPPPEGLGRAVASRLKKAAGFQVVDSEQQLPFTVLGITGQTGAGKTTVLQAVEALGGAVIDCDVLYWSLLQEDKNLIAALVEEFGAITTDDGAIDRKKLGNQVFTDGKKLLKLNEITHPVVCEKVKELISTMEHAVTTLVAIDAIALAESGLHALCDHVIAVVAPESERISRIVARDGISEEYAMQRMKAQKSEEFFRECGNTVLENRDSSKEEFFQKAYDILKNKIIKENDYV